MKKDSGLYILAVINGEAQAGCRYKISKKSTTMDALKFMVELIENYNRNLAKVDVTIPTNDKLVALRFFQENDIEGCQNMLVPCLRICSKIYVEGISPSYVDNNATFSGDVGEMWVHPEDREEVEGTNRIGIEVSLDSKTIVLWDMFKKYNINEYRIKKLKPFAKLEDFPLADLNLYNSTLNFNQLDDAMNIISLQAWRSKDDPIHIITP